MSFNDIFIWFVSASVAPEIAGSRMMAKLVCGFLGMAIACAILAGSRFYGRDSSQGKS